jgi:hypothetical protein
LPNEFGRRSQGQGVALDFLSAVSNNKSSSQ